VLPAQPRFVARDHFKVDTDDSAEVKIAYLWDDFTNNFLDKIEEEVPEAELAVRKLDKNLLDKDIRAEIGADKEETTLSQFWVLLKKQRSGKAEDGDLLVNGYANILYIKDAKGVLWAVLAGWRAGHGGWSVGASSVLGPSGWGAGIRVVSRN